MTKEYVGIKCVQAWPQEKEGKPGYAVKYEGGYVSWSPKAQFEMFYMPLGHTRAVTDELVEEFAEAIDGQAISVSGDDQAKVRAAELLDFLIGWGQFGAPELPN